MASNIGATEHHQFYGHRVFGTLSQLAVDQSGNANFTVGGTNRIYRTSFAYGEPYTVMVQFGIRWGINPAGYIFSRYAGTTLQGIRYNGSTGLQLIISNAVSRTLVVPGADEADVIVHWSMASDPLASGSMRSQVRAWNSNGSLIDGLDWTHADPNTSGSDCIFGAQVTGGSNSANADIFGAGILLHDTSEIQTRRDRISLPPAPTIDGDTAMEVPLPDDLTVFGQLDSAAGPTHWVAADAIAANNLLSVGPLVNKQWASPVPMLWGTIGTDPWFTVSPDGQSYVALPWLWRRPIPKTVNRVIVRAFVRSGRSSLTTENSVTLTAWSFSRNPGADSPEPLAAYSQSESFGPVNDTATGNPGRWVTFESVRISRTDNQLFSWLGISVEITGASASVQDCAILAVVIEPISDVETDAIAEVGFG